MIDVIQELFFKLQNFESQVLASKNINSTKTAHFSLDKLSRNFHIRKHVKRHR